MTGFSWMLVTSALLLFAGNCFAGNRPAPPAPPAVTESQLEEIVSEIWTKYKANKMFSMAVSIPKKNTGSGYDTSQVFSAENGEKVKALIGNKPYPIYSEGRIIAATFLPKKTTHDDEHAEYRVLENMNSLSDINYNKDQDLLLFYVLASPCYQKCTKEGDPKSILDAVKEMKNWKNYAFVFTHVYQSKDPKFATTEKDREEALTNLGDKSGLGLQNIFRCVPSGERMTCTRCSDSKQNVAKICVELPAENKTEVVPQNVLGTITQAMIRFLTNVFNRIKGFFGN